jgi:hypothetical protein
MSKIYKHSKTGNLYLILNHFAKETTNAEPIVVYQALYGDNQVWVRPFEEFYSKIEINGKIVDRFENIEVDRLPNIL